jgi:hypothetical protein
MQINRKSVTRFIVLALVATVPLLAQGPFAAPLGALQTFAIYFAKIVSVIALIWGFAQMAVADGHRAGGLITILFGVGGMVYAQQVVNWLFP